MFASVFLKPSGSGRLSCCGRGRSREKAIKARFTSVGKRLIGRMPFLAHK
jgi:hypothetical protein